MRFLRGIAALAVLLAGLIGVPYALVSLGGNPFPGQLSWDEVRRALFQPDDGTVLIGIITVVGWVAWLVFAVSLVTELLATISRQRIRIRLPGLGGAQRTVGLLVILVVTMLAVPQPQGQAAPITPAPSTASTASAVQQTPGPARATRGGVPESSSSTGPARGDNRPAPTEAASRSVVSRSHLVRPGDDLWSLAERYYGQGADWRRIAAANPQLLTGGPDRLEPGWRLTIPDAPGRRSAGPTDSHHVSVAAGETLSSIADREYGHAAAWPGLFRANRSVITDPDVLVVGQQLMVPTEVHTADGRFERHGSASSKAAASHQVERPKTSTAKGAGTHAAPGSARTSEQSGSGPHSVPSDPPQAEPSETASSPAASSSATAAQSPADGPAADAAVLAPILAGVSGLLAAGLLGVLAVRRRLQLRARPVGRRVRQPDAPAQLLEARLGRIQTPLDLDALDLALRAVGLAWRHRDQPMPQLLAAEVNRDMLELVFSEPAADPPAGFGAEGPRWRLPSTELPALRSRTDLTDVPQPYPALTVLGTDPSTGSQLLVNLEAVGVLGLDIRQAQTGPGPRSATSPATQTEVSGAPPDDRPSQLGSEVVDALLGSLALTPWSDELVITVVGGPHRLVDAIDRHNVGTDDAERLLRRWERRAETQRAHLAAADAQQQRVDPDLADPWSPEIALWTTGISAEHRERLRRLLRADPPVTMAAVLPGSEPEGWTLEVDESDRGAEADAVGPAARLEALGWRFVAQRLPDRLVASMSELLAATGTDDTTAAPWWQPAKSAGARDLPFSTAPTSPTAVRPGVLSPAAPFRGTPVARLPVALGRPAPSRTPPGPSGAAPHDRAPARHDGTTNVTSIGARSARRWASEESATVPESTAAVSGSQFITTGSAHAGPASDGSPAPDSGPSPGTTSSVGRRNATSEAARPQHPTLRLLGPIELVGANGRDPSRAAKQCIEYCAWLLEHPASTAQAMANGLAVAEGTRRSNMSRLRAWLGSDGNGEPYLPDAYSGRILLAPVVSSDWHRLQLLTGSGVNATSTSGLTAALQLVRGAPLADAAPGQWHWAEEMRTDMASVIRDIGVELSERALADGDLDLARWAAARSLTANPHDEQLMAARIRVEHRAGRIGEVERLTLELTAHARLLGLDLDPETVDLLQQVMEGQLRARA